MLLQPPATTTHSAPCYPHGSVVAIVTICGAASPVWPSFWLCSHGKPEIQQQTHVGNQTVITKYLIRLLKKTLLA